MQNYDTGGIIGNDPLENGSRRFGLFDDILGKFIFGDSSSSSNIFKEMTGYSSQQREFQQQEYLLEKEQEFADERNRMERLKGAGVNPLTAAAGLAGSASSPSAPAVSTNVGGAQGALSSVAGAAQQFASAHATNSKLGAEIANLNSSTEANFANIGLTNAQTQGVITDNTYKDEDWQSRLNVQRQQFENAKAEYSNILANHEQIMKHIDVMQSQIELNGSQEEYYSAMEMRIKEETRFMKEQNDFRIAHKLFITDSGVDGYIFSMIESGASMEQFDRFIEEYSRWRGSVQSAVSNAEQQSIQDHAYAIENARANGKNASDEAYGRIGSSADLAGRIAKMGTDLIGNVVGDVSQLFKSGDAKQIRSELTGVLNNAYEQLEKFPEDSERLNSLINDIRGVLSMSNKELIEWYNKQNQ